MQADTKPVNDFVLNVMPDNEAKGRLLDPIRRELKPLPMLLM